MPFAGKIFGIGHSRTGTTSLAAALERLGYRAIHNPSSLRQIAAHDAATDAPVTADFERLDRAFPGSRFIYTTRDLDDWLESWRRHWLKRRKNRPARILELRRQLLGTTDYDAILYAEAYDRLDRRIRSYFANRPEDLLIDDICRGRDRTTWDPICAFLDQPVPQDDFPWCHRTQATDQLLARALRTIGNLEETAEVTTVTTDYLQSLPANGFANQPTVTDDGGFSDGIIDAVASHLGDAGLAAAALNLPPALVDVAMERANRRRAQLRT